MVEEFKLKELNVLFFGGYILLFLFDTVVDRGRAVAQYCCCKERENRFQPMAETLPSCAVSRGRSSQHCHSSPGLLGCTVVVDHRATVGPPPPGGPVLQRADEASQVFQT